MMGCMLVGKSNHRGFVGLHWMYVASQFAARGRRNSATHRINGSLSSGYVVVKWLRLCESAGVKRQKKVDRMTTRKAYIGPPTP